MHLFRHHCLYGSKAFHVLTLCNGLQTIRTLTYYRSFGKQIHELIALKQKVERRFSNILCSGCTWMATAWHNYEFNDQQRSTHWRMSVLVLLSVICQSYLIPYMRALLQSAGKCEHCAAINVLALQDTAYCAWVCSRGFFKVVGYLNYLIEINK